MTSPSKPSAILTIRLFAGLVDLLSTTELEFSLPGPCTVGELEQRLRQDYPALGKAVFRIAVDQSYGQTEQVITESSEVALLPPVSGG